MIRIRPVFVGLGGPAVAGGDHDDKDHDRGRVKPALDGDFFEPSPERVAGMKVFYGQARCDRCHSGTFQTDLEFHAIGIPQIGPGFGGVGFAAHEDFGHERVSGDFADRDRFRTTSLRNADPSRRVLPSRPDLDPIDLIVFDDAGTTDALGRCIELDPRDLSDGEVSDLIVFLQALTDPRALDLRRSVPQRVPSGLPLAEIRES